MKGNERDRDESRSTASITEVTAKVDREGDMNEEHGKTVSQGTASITSASA